MLKNIKKCIVCKDLVIPITRTHWQANMLCGSERGSLQSPCVASCGICQLSLGPALKKCVKQIERVQRTASRLTENCDAGTRNSYQPLERVKLDTAEVTKNNQEQSQGYTYFHKALHGDDGLAFPDYVMKCAEDIQVTLARTSLLNCQRLETHYAVKLLTLSPLID